MTKRSHFHAAFAIAGLAVLLLGASTTKAQNAKTVLPGGNWTFSAGPYAGPGYDSVPVSVFSVTTEADKGLAITSVALENLSHKDVVAVKLRWYLKNGERGPVLHKGDTPLIDVDVPRGGSRQLSYPVVSFARTYKSLLKGGTLDGNYRIEVTVSEVDYADGSRWKLNEASYRKAAYRQPAQDSPCQHQGCVYNAENLSYQCNPHPGTFCSVTNTGRSCTETRCESSRPPIQP